MPPNSPTNEPELTGDEALLKEIRDRYAYAAAQWREAFEQRRIDLRYVAGDPWREKDRKARENEDNPRPCISHDELNQYLNQAINNLRQNKRGIKVEPDGSGADEQTAELKQDLVRTIEYRSQAQSAYITAYQGALEGSFGFFRISRRYVDSDELTAENFDHQELRVTNIANAESVLYDPDCKEADWSDAEYCFVLNPIPREEFERKYPNREIRDFSNEHLTIAKDWLQDRQVLTAEYWKATTTSKTVYKLKSGRITEEKPANAADVAARRTVTTRRITQFITNGVEILKRNPEPGGCKIIPIVPVIGKEMYVDDGAGARRVLMSLVRLARDPQMTLAYLCSQEAEEAGLTPKVPYKGYVGQFETDSEAWENITRVPRAFVQADPIVDAATGQVLPLPVREQFTPNFQQYEIAKDSARRAIQAAMGISPLPTAAQRANQKSGVAIERIETQQGVGSFHFLDNFDRALMLAGRIIDERIKPVYGQPGRELMLARADDKHRRVRLNTPEPYYDEDLKATVHYPVDKGTHTYTISSGPSYQSQREAVGSFVDLLLQNLKDLPIPPPAAQKILAIAIQMKQLGPKGDQLAEIIAPPQKPGEMPPEAQAAVGQMQGLVQALQGELQKLIAEKQGKVVDNEYRLQIERMKIEAATAQAEIATKAQRLEERMQFVEDLWKQLHGQAHEAAMQAVDHSHDQDLAQQQQQAAAQQQQDQQPEPAMA